MRRLSVKEKGEDMGKNIIFLDIDGTFTEPGCNTPPDSAVEAIRKTQERGNLVFLCTGRNQGMAAPVMKYGMDGIIASGGGRIISGWGESEEVLYDCPMTEEQRVRVLTSLEKNGVYRTVECLHDSFTDESFKEFIAQSAMDGNSELLRWRKQIEENLNILPMAEYRDQPVYKVIVMSPEKDNILKAGKEWTDDFHLILQEPDRYGIVNGEVVNKNFDKGQAVLRVCEHFGIPVEDTYGFGDSENDREMLETVGTSVCMENGAASMKEISDVVAPAVTEDGLLKSFGELGLL